MRHDSIKLQPAWINVFFLYVGLLTLVNGLLITKLSRNWIVSDWLINYQGGFVRRGLPGEAAYLLSRLFHVSPVFFAALFFLSLYAVFFWAVRALALRSSLNFWVVVLLVSPATLSFQILHPQAGFRKEIFFLAALALFVMLLQTRRLSSLAAAAYITVAVGVGIVSHEAMFFYAPYFFAALVLGGRSLAQAARICILPVAVALAALYLCSTHLGSFDTATRICSSLGYKFIVKGSTEVCASGAIPYLIRSRAYARAETLLVARQFHYLVIFPLFGLLALVPCIAESLVLFRDNLRRDLAVLWATALVAILGSIFLFIYGVDWGRWIYIHVTSITVLLLEVDARRAVSPARVKVIEWRRFFTGPQLAYPVFFVVYTTFWILPVCYEPLRLGYIGRATVLAHRATHPGEAGPPPPPLPQKVDTAFD